MRGLGDIYCTAFSKLTRAEKLVGILTFPLVYPYMAIRYFKKR